MDPLSWNLVRFVAPKRSLQTPADNEADIIDQLNDMDAS